VFRGSAESKALYVVLVHEISARVVTVPKQCAKEGTVRRGGRAPTVLNHKLNEGEFQLYSVAFYTVSYLQQQDRRG
jgi:hypothetical protein